MTSNHLPTSYQEFIHLSRYSRWLPEKNRRETWAETVNRYFNFFEEHLKDVVGYKVSRQERNELEEAVLGLEIMPSMRCLMTAGEALKRENVAGYNCSYVAVDSPRAFDEILYILMNGTGVGFSVEQKFTDQLPIIAEDFYPSDTTIVVGDSKLGWAKALKEVIHLLYGGQVPTWDVSKVRPAGSPLKTFGGRASGPEPLVSLFQFAVRVFKNAAGRKLTPLECHDIVCKIAEIVVVGGVRRSALISLSDLSDDGMRKAKSGAWWENNAQRALANNSFVANRKPDIGVFMKEWLSLYESKSGERGIFSRGASKAQAKKYGRRNPDFDFGTNPCCLVGSTLLTTQEFGKKTLKEIVELHNEKHIIHVLAFNLLDETQDWVPVEAAQLTRPNAEVLELEIETANGTKTIRCTPDHPIYTNNRGYVRADELSKEDDLVISS